MQMMTKMYSFSCRRPCARLSSFWLFNRGLNNEASIVGQHQRGQNQRRFICLRGAIAALTKQYKYSLQVFYSSDQDVY